MTNSTPTEADIDRLAATIYQAKSQSSREMTDARWAGIKTKFRGSARICRDEAIRMYEDGEMDD